MVRRTLNEQYRRSYDFFFNRIVRIKLYISHDFEDGYLSLLSVYIAFLLYIYVLFSTDVVKNSQCNCCDTVAYKSK